MIPKTFTFVDTETTGYSATDGRVIEIALIRVEEGEVIDEFKSLVNPREPISRFIQNYTGIDSEELEYAPDFYQLSDRIESILADSVFVAHNVNFDRAFLKAEFQRVDRPFNNPYFCTVRLSRKLYPQMGKHNLSRLIEYFNFECESRHRAYDDAHVLLQFINHAKFELGEDLVNEAILSCLQN